MSKLLYIKRIVLVLSILYLVLITVLSLCKFGNNAPKIEIQYLDKVVHFCFYFGLNMLILASLALQRFRSSLYRGMFISTALVILYSIIIEFVQKSVGRDCDLFDMIANSAGALAALALFCFLSSKGLLDKILSKL